MIKRFPARFGFLSLLIFFSLSVWLIFQYVAAERQRDLAAWQSRLGMLADVRRSAVENEMQQQRALLHELANNPSLQLYLAQNHIRGQKDDIILSAQLSHVRNLLAAYGERFGFKLQHNTAVNLASPFAYGIAITDQEGALLAASKGFPQNSAAITASVANSLRTGQHELIDMQPLLDSQPVYGFVEPVFPVQGMSALQTSGSVVVLLDPRLNLYRQLENHHLDTQSDETLMLRLQANSLMAVSPLRKDFSLFHQIASRSDLAEAHAAQRSGDFIQALDYRSTEVLATGRSIRNTPWILVQKIDSAEALAESNRHQRFLFTSFLLVAGLISVSFIAIWRHSTSVRLQQLTQSLAAQTALLNAVSDNIHDIIFLLDANRQLVFANLSLANLLGIAPTDAVGKHPASVFGPDIADQLEQITCHQDRGSARCVVNLTLGKQCRSYHVSSVVLTHGDYQNAVLYVLHDISEIKNAQEKRERLAQGIIGTLVKAVDLHDPYCVDHSSRTREVAMCIAHELRLDKPRREALEMAALLANIGKLFVPREILTKMEALSDHENELLKKHIHYAVEILKQLDFEGPVVEIIAQKNEYLDGSGYPKGLQGEAILTESRILTVANAFVAMASARAYRHGRPIKEVMDILLQQSDQRYDRHVVAALFHIAENQADWRSWQTAKPLN